MGINTHIKPLYDALMAIRFDQFADSNDFVRVCNEIGITQEYTEAHNQAAEITYFYSDTKALLRILFNQLYSESPSRFPGIVSEMVISFLNQTHYNVEMSEVINDLDSLQLGPIHKEKLLEAYKKHNKNLRLKVRSLVDILVSRARGGLFDYVKFMRLKGDLMRVVALKPLLPEYVIQTTSESDFWFFIKAKFPTYREREDYIRESFEKISALLDETNSTIAEAVKIDEQYVKFIWDKALDRMNTDPEAAITSARTLLESVFKYILDETNEPYKDGEEFDQLYTKVARKLKLSPDQHTEQQFRQILSGCNSVVKGLGSIRNKISDAHAIGPKRAKPSLRHAQLAVNLSGSMAQFLLQTFKHNYPSDQLASSN